jgi:fructokinase
LMRLGIDLGGTKIAAIVLAEDQRVVWESRSATPRGDYAATIDAIAGLVEAGEAAAGSTCTVGIGMPGAISPATGWSRTPIPPGSTAAAQRRSRAASHARAALANDANCLAVSEAVDGAAAGRRVVFGVILGTGTGGGIAIDGHAWIGANAIAGEWGHNPLPWPTGRRAAGTGVLLRATRMSRSVPVRTRAGRRRIRTHRARSARDDGGGGGDGGR